MGEKVSRGYLRKVVEKASAALEAPYEELLKRLPLEQALNVDETGHKDNGEKFWTWVFRAELYVLFKIDKTRSSKVLLDVLGEAFNALLFLFRHVLKTDYDLKDKVVRARRTRYIPVVLTRDEVNRVVAAIFFITSICWIFKSPRSLKPRWVLTVFACMFFYYLHTHGGEGGALWGLLVPAITPLLLGLKSGVILSVTYLALVLGTLASGVFTFPGMDPMPDFTWMRFTGVYLLAGLIASLHEYITLRDRRSLERELQERIRAREREQFNVQFQQLAAESSARFLTVEDSAFDDTVNQLLANLGNLLDGDRSYLLRFSDDLSIMDTTHEWCAPGIESQLGRVQQVPTNEFPWWMDRIRELRLIHIPDVSVLPAEAAREKEEWQAQDIQSLLCLPIVSNHGALIGFMGFDSVRLQRTWPEQHISMLQIIAEIIGNAISRIETHRVLHESEAYNRAIIQAIPDIIILTNYEGEYLDIRAATERALFMPTEYLLGKTIEDVLPDNVASKFMAGIRDVLDKQALGVVEYKLTVPAGDCHFEARLVHQSKERVLALIRNISEQKRAETELIHSRYREKRKNEFLARLARGTDLQAMLLDLALFTEESDPSIRASVLLYDEARDCLVNAAFLELWGYSSPDEVIGRHVSEFLANEHEAKCILLTLQECERWDGEYAAKRKDGSVFWAASLATVLKDANGKLIGYQSSVLDITEQKQAEEALRKSEEQFRLLAENVPGVVCLCRNDECWTMLYISDSVEKLTGYSGEEFRSNRLSFADLYHPDDRAGVYAHSEYSRMNNIPFLYTYRIRHRDGSWRWVEESANALLQPDGSFLFECHLLDMTERRKAEEALIESKRQLEAAVEHARIMTLEAKKANEAKGRFLAGMSHEIRTPLNAILGFSQLLQRDPVISAEQRTRVETINRSGEYLLALLNNILDFSKIESGRQTVERGVFNLRAIIRDVVAMFSLRAKDKGLTLTTEGLDQIPRVIYADEQKIQQILINLLGNAVKFTMNGGIRLSIMPQEGEGAEVRLVCMVEDTGPGIAEEDRERVFDAFEQTEGSQGTGLGLTIGRQLARLMGGDLTLASERGRGSVFRFELPVLLAEDRLEQDPAIDRPVPRLAEGQPQRRVLVAEDAEDDRVFLTELLDDDIRSRILNAAIGGHKDRLDALIIQATSEMPDLQEQLLRLSNRFDYETLIDLLQRK